MEDGPVWRNDRRWVEVGWPEFGNDARMAYCHSARAMNRSAAAAVGIDAPHWQVKSKYLRIVGLPGLTVRTSASTVIRPQRPVGQQ